jgi:hypothetical protein
MLTNQRRRPYSCLTLVLVKFGIPQRCLRRFIFYPCKVEDESSRVNDYQLRQAAARLAVGLQYEEDQVGLHCSSEKSRVLV